MKKSYKITCALLALLMLIASFGAALSVSADGNSDDYTTINLLADYTFGDAHEMQNDVNNFRTGKEAEPGGVWWYTDDTKTTMYIPTDKTSETGTGLLVAYEYDYDLEKIAMQRAAEISVLFAHQRPDDTKYTTAYEEICPGKFQRMGENIAAGTDMDKEAAYLAWREDTYGYSGQGHRRNMLNEHFTKIGIAHAVIDEIDYWVQEFGTPVTDDGTSGTRFVPDGKYKMKIKLSDKLLNPSDDPTKAPSAKFEERAEVKLEYGEVKDPPFALLTYAPPGALGKNENGQVFGLTSSTAADSDIPDIYIAGAFSPPEGQNYKATMISYLESEYTSADTTKVKVSDTGELTGEGLGKTEVTISAPKYHISDKFTVNVVRKDISDCTEIILDEDSFEFCGKDIKPEPSNVIDKDLFRPLVKTTDYTLDYEDNRDTGEHAKVIVRGTGNFAGEASAEFKITPLNIENGEVTLEYKSTPYTGTARTPRVVSVKAGDVTLEAQAASGAMPAGGTGGNGIIIPVKQGDDFDVEYSDNVNIGEHAKATLKSGSKNNITFSNTTGEFAITKAKSDDVTVTPEYTETEYDGKVKEPKVTVKIGDTELKAGTDYKVIYSDNTDIGKAKITVEGQGNFSDIKKELEFDITPISIKKATVTPEYTTKEYTGSELKPKVTVKLGDTTLKEGDDYTVAYSDNKEAGKATVTVTGKGKYMDTATGSFTITAPCEHKWDSGKVTKAATCKEKGVMTYTCSECKATKTEDIALAAHTPGDAATCGAAQKCTVCGKVLAAATEKHTDSNKDGKCDVCGASVSTGNNTNNGSTTIQGNQNSPNTGSDDMDTDHTARNLMILSIFLASAVCTVIVIRRRAIDRQRAECTDVTGSFNEFTDYDRVNRKRGKGLYR